MKAYKTFDDKTADGRYITRPTSDKEYVFEINKEYFIESELKMCSNGFHFHQNQSDVFRHKNHGSVVCEIEVLGDIIHGGDKSVTNRFKIIRELSRDEMNSGKNNVGYFNAGSWNAGDGNAGDMNAGNWNAGNRNAGDMNAGNWNAGNWNAGNMNAGNWNAGNRNTGHFNTKNPSVINVFNKSCEIEDWEKAYKPSFLYFSLCLWISADDMDDEEKEKHPEHKTAGGYLKKLSYKEAFMNSWKNADREDRYRIKDLPNFDKDIFFELSGIDVDAD